MDISLSRRFAPSGLVVAGIGFFLTRFTVTLATYEAPIRFVVGGAIPLVLGLGLAAFGVALFLGGFERAFVNTVALWCVAGATAMFALVLLTLAGNGTSLAMEPVRSQTYLSNFLIGGSVGGALTGVYAGRSTRQRRELSQQASQLEMVNRLLRDNVLNAMTVIRGRAEVLQTTEHGDSLAAIERRSEDVESTIEHVKHITRDGDATSTLDPTPVAACVASAADTVRERYPAAHVSVDSVESDVTVWANPLLEEALMHLAENAVAYSDAPTPTAEVRVTATDDVVTVAVTDNGPGLPDDQRQFIERGEIAAYDDRSTGFGLNIVRLLARSYDGSLDATVTDSGTTVTLGLRRADTAAGPVTDTDTTPRHRQPDLAAATGAALVAGGIMGGFLQIATGAVPVIGALYGSGGLWVGWITHAFHSVVFGLIYAGLVTHVPEQYGDWARYYGVGIVWAGFLWLAAASVVMPLWLRLVGIAATVPNVRGVLLAGHLVWGLTLATAYRVSGSLRN